MTVNELVEQLEKNGNNFLSLSADALENTEQEVWYNFCQKAFPELYNGAFFTMKANYADIENIKNPKVKKEFSQIKQYLEKTGNPYSIEIIRNLYRIDYNLRVEAKLTPYSRWKEYITFRYHKKLIDDNLKEEYFTTDFSERFRPKQFDKMNLTETELFLIYLQYVNKNHNVDYLKWKSDYELAPGEDNKRYDKEIDEDLLEIDGIGTNLKEKFGIEELGGKTRH